MDSLLPVEKRDNVDGSSYLVQQDQCSLIAVVDIFPILQSSDIGETKFGEVLASQIQICLPELIRSWKFLDGTLIDHELLGKG